MNRVVVIIGASGHGRVVADIVRANGDIVLGFLDDDSSKDTIGKISDWDQFKENEFVIGVGNSEVRERISQMADGAKWYTAIHPSAIISPSATIGKGTVIMPNAVVNTGTKIGVHSIVNSGAIVEHDNRVGDYCHISVGARLGGTVSVGDSTWVGIGVVVRNNVNICEGCMIGAGAVVVKSIGEPGTYIGVPARKESIKHCDCLHKE